MMASTHQFRGLFAVGTQLVDSTGNRSSLPDLPPDGVLGLYFTAYCFGDEFTPTLVDFCQRLKQRQQQNGTGRRFEVITVSLDDDQESFDELKATMPWPVVKTYDEGGAVSFQPTT
jgi:cytochrome oxidase Cu insertion factor (SCO1/SenC/PrrC family)